jgi:tricarballylate dehydrogenase
MEHTFDLVVVGCGIAGLATAVSAAENGLKVAVLERATIEDRGGNTRWTEALMRMKNETEVADDLEDHFMANSGFHLDPSLVQEAGNSHDNRSAIVRALGFTDPEIISTLSSEAGKALTWLKKFGITYSDMPTYLITQSTTRLMPVGGGWALVEALVKAGENLGVKFFYETTAVKLIQSDDGTVCGLLASNNQTRSIKFMGKVMLACGGFEGNQEMQALYYGAKSRYIRPIARGGYYNKGEGIKMALGIGAAPCGDFSEYHAEPIDPRSGQPEPIVFVFPYGILVTTAGKRFIDEASNTVDAIYENIARLINELPGGVSYVICDQKLDLVPNWQRTVRSDQKPITADTIEELAEKLGIPSAQLVETVSQYNKATKKGTFKPLELDGLATEGLTPPKSNWALPIDQGPYRAWPISSANCFTFGGLRCNTNAQVLDTDGRPIAGLYAAGETMGLYYGKYTGATSVMRGLVFGRLAGQHAAQK